MTEEITQDLFGDAPDQSQATAKGRGPKGGKHYVKPRGYAAMPGTGPAGETCGTCAHCARFHQSKRWSKCVLIKGKWTHGRSTDILTGSPACSKWNKTPPT